MEVEREALRRQGYDPDVIATIQSARRASTNRAYQATWQTFCSWCSSQGVPPLRVPIPILLRFLQRGLNLGLAPNTLKRQVAALSTVLSCPNYPSLSVLPTVHLFLKGATNSRSPVAHRFPNWDLTLVLDSLTGAPYEPLQGASMSDLTHKVAFLIAITSARRVSEIAALSMHKELCVFLPDRVILRVDPTFVPKVNTVFHRSQDIILPAFCPCPRLPEEKVRHTLDVRRALRVYLDRTAPFRKSEALLVNFNSRSLGRKVSASTVSKWLKDTISRAYILAGKEPPLGVTAHSTRSAATSTAWSARSSLQEICRAAVWSSPSQFTRHYKVDSFAGDEPCLGLHVLQQATGLVS